MSEPVVDMKRSTRDPGVLRERLERWLAGRLGAGTAPAVAAVRSPSATGMSSETLLFDAAWTERGERREGAFVARVAPDPNDVPVFPRYDLAAQFRLLQIVAAHSTVPVPRVRWLEEDPSHLGAPFFVMDRVEGRVPPDVMPYTFGSWVSEASPAERRQLQDASVATLAALHAIDVASVDVSFLALDAPGTTALRRQLAYQRRYYDWVRGEHRHPLIERALDWLDANCPRDEGPTVINWGDARIGNMLFQGFEPVAVLDWEMATLGPREVDLGWFRFLHVFFDDLAHQFQLPGLPDFMRREDVARTYEAHSGHRVRDLPFYETFAALRHAIIMARVHARRVHFGEAEWPADPDEVIPHRAILARMLDGDWDG
ncbi:MAG TPA: phosphotransferase family protein [Candidatus Limnocylindria bacterium]|nr:phosphotransferase family protein [Candidatus Limnocylindria bacterium]